MIKISCAQLEQVKQNPLGYARILANDNKPSQGGTHGIFAYWKDAVRSVNRGEKDIKAAMNELAIKYTNTFEPVSRNLNKEEKLLSVFHKYCEQYEKLGLNFLLTHKQVNWQLHDNVTLCGHTPWITKRDNEFFVFSPVEDPSMHWREELKHPLFQQYLASHCYNEPISAFNIGIYSIPDNAFDFQKFNKEEINSAIVETKYLFTIVSNEYLKVKK